MVGARGRVSFAPQWVQRMFFLQVLAMLGILVLSIVTYCAAVRCMRWHLRRSAPEIKRLPEDEQQKLLAALTSKELEDEKADKSWGARIRMQGWIAAMTLAIIGLLSLITKLGLPIFWTSIAVFLVLGLPLIRFLCYLHQRPRITRVLRKRLIQSGILICPHCATDLQGNRPAGCPACRKTIDWNSLDKAPPPPEEIVVPIAAAPSDRPRRMRAIVALLVFLGIPIILAVGLVYMKDMPKQAKQLRREAWHQVDVPSSTIMKIDDPNTFGFFVRSDSDAEVVSEPDDALPEGGIRLQLIDEKAREPLELRTPSAAREGRQWNANGTDVRIVRAVDVPSAGSYRLIVDGDPADGPLFWRPRQLAEQLKLLAKMAAPLVLILAIFGAYRLRQYMRDRRNKTPQVSSPAV